VTRGLSSERQHSVKLFSTIDLNVTTCTLFQCELSSQEVPLSTTFPRLLLDHAEKRPHAAALREKEYGIWQTTTWAVLLQRVRFLAAGLSAAGLKRGQHVVVIGDNRPRLSASMIAAQVLGAIPVPLYQDAVSAEFVFPINNAEVSFAIAEDQEQVDKLIELRPECPQLARIWYDNPRGLRNYSEPGLASLDSLMEQGADLDKKHPARFSGWVSIVKPSDVAAMFFTSGTTGHPKGVVHTHFTLIDRALAGAAFDKLTSDEEVLAYLPPAWIGQNIFSYAQWLACGYVVNCPESAETVSIDLERDRPDLLLRTAARIRRHVHLGDDPHGRRGRDQALALQALHGRGASRRTRTHGPQAARLQ
jgi:long-chain acyl-CoA synthetase